MRIKPIILLLSLLVSLLLSLLLSGVALADSLGKAQALIDEGEYQRAADVLRGAMSDPALKPQALVLATHAFNGLEDHKQGVEHGKQAIAALPEDSRAHLEYARALRIKMQNSGMMRAMMTVGSYKKEVRRALELDPSNADAREEEIGFLTHAPGIAGGDSDKARKKIEEFKKIDWRKAMFMQAELQSKEKDTDGVRETYAEMLERDPADEDARLNLAFMLQQGKRYDEADAHFTALAESEEPRRALSAQYQMARSRILGEFEQEKAVELLLGYIEKLSDAAGGLPSRSAAYWRLGNAYEQLSKTGDARTAYQKALELDGDNDEAKKALKKLGRG